MLFLLLCLVMIRVLTASLWLPPTRHVYIHPCMKALQTKKLQSTGIDHATAYHIRHCHTRGKWSVGRTKEPLKHWWRWVRLCCNNSRALQGEGLPSSSNAGTSGQDWHLTNIHWNGDFTLPVIVDVYSWHYAVWVCVIITMRTILSQICDTVLPRLYTGQFINS